MDKVTTIGLDLAKTYFVAFGASAIQVHGVDEHGRTVVQRRLRRSEVLVFFRKLSPCLVGMEACATAHHWARELLELGHDVRLMPPAYVKAYVTLADWVGVASFHLKPVVDRLAEHLKRSTKLFMDETTTPVLDPGK